MNNKKKDELAKIKGALNIMTLLIIFILLIAFSTPHVETFSMKRRFWFAKKLDDTDNLTTGERSNLVLYIDHGTGVHYIKTPFGPLVPRLDADGDVVSEYKQEEIRRRGNDE